MVLSPADRLAVVIEAEPFASNVLFPKGPAWLKNLTTPDRLPDPGATARTWLESVMLLPSIPDDGPDNDIVVLALFTVKLREGEVELA